MWRGCPCRRGGERGQTFTLTPALCRGREREPSQQRIAAFDLLLRLEHGVGLGGVAVGHAPLDFADPHAHAGQLGGVFVQLDAEQVVRAGDEVLLAVQPQRGGLGDADELDVLERLQAHEQKVAAAAGGVEDAKGTQLLQPVDEAGVGLAVGGVAVFGGRIQQ